MTENDQLVKKLKNKIERLECELEEFRLAFKNISVSEKLRIYLSETLAYIEEVEYLKNLVVEQVGDTEDEST